MFDTLKYAKMLEEVGFTRDQAETTIRILDETMEDKLATQQDLKDLTIATRQEFKDFTTAIHQDFANHKTEIQQQFKEVYTRFDQLEMKLTIRMGTMLAASIAVLTAIQKLA